MYVCTRPVCTLRNNSPKNPARYATKFTKPSTTILSNLPLANEVNRVTYAAPLTIPSMTLLSNHANTRENPIVPATAVAS